MTPGEWTPTGLGAQHRIRAVNTRRVVFVCHADQVDHYIPLHLLNTDAAETARCVLCELTPDLGPPPAPTLDQVRVDPATGTTVVCTLTWDNRIPSGPLDDCWRIIRWGSRRRHGGERSLLCSYDVARWIVVGRLPDLGDVA
jgi:hypothetical protein